MEISLAGRTALITGESKGIGLSIAKTFAQSGADVALLARERHALDRSAKLVDAAGPSNVLAVAADVSDAAAIERAYG